MRIGPTIVKDNLILHLDDKSYKCYNSGSTMYNLADIESTLVLSGTVSHDTDGHIYYDGSTTFGIFSRNYIDQADLTKNIETNSNLETYTMEAWVRIPNDVSGDTTSGWQIMGHNSSLGIGIQLMRNSSLNLINFGYRTNSNFYSTVEVPVDEWTHIVGTRRNPGTPITEIYINGTVDTNVTGATTMDIDPTTSAFHTGRTSARITGWFKGNIPIMRLYNVGLSAKEVLHNYNVQKKRFGK